MSDGGENVRRMQEYLHPFSEHLIDWFHITMRLTVLQQQTKGLKQEQPQAGEDISKRPASVKHLLWHGNTEEALERRRWYPQFRPEVACSPDFLMHSPGIC